MTNRLNHLEEQGLIERIHDPDDKRSTLVSLAYGRERIEQALLVHTETQNAILANLSQAKREQLESLKGVAADISGLRLRPSLYR
jgi:DNA-binding MarR family transcriptional regulator